MLLPLCLLLSSGSTAQQWNFLTGASIDVGNKARFFQVPLIVQFLPQLGRSGSLLLTADFGIPLAARDKVLAFTLDQQLPSQTSVNRRITQQYFVASVGYRAFLNRDEARRWFLDLVPFGIGRQWFRVKYDGYDAANYEILDPDLEKRKTGYQVSVGVGVTMGSLTIQSHIYSPLGAKMGRYENSYHYGAPLQLTAGYVLPTGSKKKS